jgi:hypothetical protein
MVNQKPKLLDMSFKFNNPIKNNNPIKFNNPIKNNNPIKFNNPIKNNNPIKFNNPINNTVNNILGASHFRQQQWKSFSQPQKNIFRQQFKDSDKDGVPNKWDCSPFNPKKQDNQIFLNAFKVKTPEKYKDDVMGLKAYHQRQQDGKTLAYTMPGVYKDTTFLGKGMKDMDFNDEQNIKYLADVLEHEEIHTILQENKEGKLTEESAKFDNIVVPSHTITDENNNQKIVNPNTANKFSLKTRDDVNDIMFNENLSEEDALSQLSDLDNQYGTEQNTIEEPTAEETFPLETYDISEEEK